MNLNNASASVPNAVVTHNPAATKPVGLESDDMRQSTFKPVEEGSATAKLASRPENDADRTPGPIKSNAENQDDAENEARDRAREDAEARQVEVEQRKIQELAARDREVRAHEQAHASSGGQYAGAPTYQLETGPDGRSYAVGGEVQIDAGRAGTPQETIQKAKVVRNAALAPAEPSPQDRRVAAMASRMESQARVELREQSMELEKMKREEILAEEERAEEGSSTERAQKAKDSEFEKTSAANDAGGATGIVGLEKTNSTFSQISSSETNSSKGSILDQLA